MRKKEWLLLGGVYVALLIAIPWLLFVNYQEKERTYLQHKTQEAAIELQALISALDRVADVIFGTVIDKPHVRNLMHEAYLAYQAGDTAKLTQLRTALHTQLADIYLNLKEHEIRQLHFHLPHNISFLRMHRPEKFGDSIRGTRHSIDQVNLTHQAVKGFEEGRIFNGFRNVYPLMWEGEFVGTVEISYSYEAIRKTGMANYPVAYSFIIKKEDVASKVWKEEQSAYEPAPLSEHYLHDRAIMKALRAALDAPGAWLGYAQMEEVERLLAPLVAQRIMVSDRFTVPVRAADHSLLVSFVPILNQKAEHVAFHISFREEDYLRDSYRHMWMTIVIALLVYTLLVALFAIYYHAVWRKRELERIATVDRLTGVANRLAFDVVLEQTYKEAKRTRRPFSVAMADIDDFKKVNDIYGHAAGDQVLIAFANTLRESAREVDNVARWGGEEFAMVFAAATPQQAAQVLERARHNVAALAIEYKNSTITLTASFGVCGCDPTIDPQEMVRRADSALYEAKRKGKNRICIYEPPST